MCRVFGLILVICLLVTCVSPLSVSAIDSEPVEDFDNPSFGNFSITAEDAPIALCNRLRVMGISVSNTSVIELVPMEHDRSVYALVVTNTDGNMITKTSLVSISSEGEFQNLVTVVDNSIQPLAGGTGYLPDTDGTYVEATAVYNIVYDDYIKNYQPVGLIIMCHINDSDTLSYVSVVYQCSGYECTYPGFEFISDNTLELYDHNIGVQKSNPGNKTKYHNSSNPYRTDRVIYVNSGHPLIGQYFIYSITINGQNIASSARIFDN